MTLLQRKFQNLTLRSTKRGHTCTCEVSKILGESQEFAPHLQNVPSPLQGRQNFQIFITSFEFLKTYLLFQLELTITCFYSS